MKENTNSNWFEERELPTINNQNDLEKAFSIIKNKFNGSPKFYTRTDFILFINTLYAALKKSFDIGSASATLTSDIQSNYFPEVGFIKENDVISKGTDLTDALKMIFEGQPDALIDLDQPTIESSLNGEDWYDYKGDITITIDNSNTVDSLIFYTLSTDHGARIYTDPFKISKDTIITAWCVPTKYTHKYNESSKTIESYNRIYQTSLILPTVNHTSYYNYFDINLIDNNIVDKSNYEIQYRFDSNDQWKIFDGNTIKSISTYFEVRCISKSENYLSTGSLVETFNFEILDNPIVLLTNTTYHKDSSSNKEYQLVNGSDYTFIGTLSLTGVLNSNLYDYIRYFADSNEIDIYNDITDISELEIIGYVSCNDEILQRSCIVNIERNYEEISDIIIHADEYFDEKQQVTIGVVNPENYNIEYKLDDNDWTPYHNSFEVTDTCTIYCKISVLENVEPMFNVFENQTEKEVHLNQQYNIYVNLYDPIGKQYEDVDDYGDPITITVVENEAFFITGLTGTYEPSTELREITQDCYGVMYPDNVQQFYVYSAKKDKLEGIKNIQILSDNTDGWPLIQLGNSDITKFFTPTGISKTINDKQYYEFALDISNAGIESTASALIKFIK